MSVEHVEDLNLEIGDDIATRKGVVVGSVLKWDEANEMSSGWFNPKVVLTNHTTLQNVELYLEDFMQMLRSGIYKIVKN